jgi:hypothetical protein
VAGGLLRRRGIRSVSPHTETERRLMNMTTLLIIVVLLLLLGGGWGYSRRGRL